MSSDPQTLSRSDLQLVWPKPISELAKDFGLSDVAVAKRCRRLGVPVPGRGYWARLAAGQSPRVKALPKREDEPGDHSALTFGVHVERDDGEVKPAVSVEEAAVRERIDALMISGAESLAVACGNAESLDWE